MKKILSFTLVIVMLLALVPTMLVSSEVFEQDYSTGSTDSFEYSKITEELRTVLDGLNDEDMVQVYLWINDIDYQMVEEPEFYSKSSENLIQTVIQSLLVVMIQRYSLSAG